ncbi:MAG: NAD(P)/FAD-dependent oxidoreductase [Candidatus Babeliales bacterium]
MAGTVFYAHVICLLIVCGLHAKPVTYDYDLVVIGAGASGLVAAIAAAEKVKRVAIIEKEDRIGGSHTWTGDIPSKTLINLANMSHELVTANKFGLCDTRNVHVNSSHVLPYIRSVCQKVYDIHSPDFFICSEIKVIHGVAQFVDSHTIRIDGTDQITADKFIIATGSTPKIPPVAGIKSIKYLTADTFFSRDTLPLSMIIVGAGPLGTEIAAALNRLGVKVTLIMKYGVILPTFDFELVELLMAILHDEGVTIRCNVEAHEVEEQDDGTIVLHCVNKNGMRETYAADSLFLATNRRARVQELNLQAAGVEITNRGITVNKYMQTTADNIFACGDVVGQYILSRVAYYQARIAVQNATRQWWQSYKKTSYTDVAKVAFTQPMIASTGLTEQEARKQYGSTIVIHRISYNYLSKALIDNKPTGMAKFVYDSNGILLGAHILGEQAGNLIDLLKVGKRLDIQLNAYSSHVYTSPSYLDLLWLALEKYRAEFPPATTTCVVCNTILDWFAN